MGKYASRDGSSSVAWADITGKPATFTPAAHSNTAHSTAYAPVDSPTFTTDIENMGVEYWRGSTKILNKAANDWLDLFTRDTSGADAVMNASNIGSLSAVRGTLTSNNYSGTNRPLTVVGYNASSLSDDPLVDIQGNYESFNDAPVLLRAKAYDADEGFQVWGNGDVLVTGVLMVYSE